MSRSRAGRGGFAAEAAPHRLEARECGGQIAFCMVSALVLTGRADGEEALRFQRRTGDFAGMPRPALVVLDLNLPRRSGLEVLGELKADPDLHTIPVVVLTASRAGTDIVRSCELHANANVIKPSGVARFAAAIGQIGDFFLILAERPH